LLKAIHHFKYGTFVNLPVLKKMNEDFSGRVEELIFENNDLMKEKANFLRKIVSDKNFYVNLSFVNDPIKGEKSVRAWFLCVFPEQNMIAVAEGNNPSNNSIYYFKIVMQQGDVNEKFPAKIRELNHVMTVLDFDFDPVVKDKRILRKTKYNLAIKKLSFLRLLRKSIIGTDISTDMDKFQKAFKVAESRAKITDSSLLI